MTRMQTGDDPRVRVLVTDDQSIVRQGLGVILSHAPGIEVVGFAENGRQAVEMTASTRPDLVLMDLKMPVMNGIHATRAIVQQFPQVKVLVLTTYDGDEWLFDAIRAGACGYLLKDVDADAVLRAIHGAVKGEVHLDPHIAGKVIQAFAQRPAQTGSPVATQPAAEEPVFEALTEREQAILQELAQGKSNQEIAETLFLAEGTVKNYVSTILAKLHANDRTQAAIIALKRGLATLE